MKHFGKPGRREWLTVSRYRALERERKERITRMTVSLALMAAVTVASVASVAASARHASILVDGVKKPDVEIDSTDRTAILRQASIPIGKNDAVLSWQKDGDVYITVRTAKRLTVKADGKSIPVIMNYGDTVADALVKAGVTVYGDDIVSQEKTAAVTDGMTIEVTRRCTVNIAADGKTVSAIVPEGTVSNALSQAGVTLGAEDITDKSLTSRISDGMTISIGRISYKDVTTTEAVPFETVTQKDSSLNAGTKKITAQGQNGVKTIVTHQKLCDGKVVESSVVSSGITQQPVSQVVVLGTRSLGSAFASVGTDGTLIDQDGNRVSYSKVFTGRCTAYSGGYRTASGMATGYGRVAVNPNVIPYHTKLYICSPNGGVVYGYAVAADTGGAAMNGSIVADLYYTDYDESCNFGSRTMNVYVLN